MGILSESDGPRSFGFRGAFFGNRAEESTGICKRLEPVTPRRRGEVAGCDATHGLDHGLRILFRKWNAKAAAPFTKQITD
jgi:hypothetical protein